MAQVGLDPIESHGSMELSASRVGQAKRLINSEQKTQPEELACQQALKKKKRTVEEGFVDVSEQKMREFVMS